MDNVMPRALFIETLRSVRAKWDNTVIDVPRDLLEEPGVEGQLSIKDLSAHIAWYEHEMVELLQSRVLTGSALWELPNDERNNIIFEENRYRDLDDVLSSSGHTFRQLLREVEALSDEDLNNPSHFQDMPADWLPWKLIAENSYEHYPEHTNSVIAWLQG
jgi:hypothetical protein